MSSTIRTPETDRICADCWRRACDCFATAKIFSRRARKYRKLVNSLSFLGIGVPAVFGTVVLAYGSDFSGFKNLVWWVLAIGVVQLALSCASIIGDWSGELEYSHESAIENFALADEFELLAKTATKPFADLGHRYERLLIMDKSRRQQDYKREVTIQETSRGYRESLIQFRQACAKCGIEPHDIKPTNCIACGNFDDD